MSDAAPAAAAAPPAFSPKVILALVLVGVVAFAGLAVLAAYAPDLRGGDDARAHALSRSAIGYAGAPILMEKLGVPATVSRLSPRQPQQAVVILTPDLGLSPEELRAYPKGPMTLIVLPKWFVARDPIRRGFVRKGATIPDGVAFQDLLASYAKTTRIRHEKGRYAWTLQGFGPLAGRTLPVGAIEGLQTISGDGWAPALTDGRGRMVLAYSRKTPGVWVLADPDLLNNHGLADLNRARAAVAILETARKGDRSLVFDVTLNGFERGRGFWRTMLEPPWLAATLIGVMAAVLMGVHALARFGQPQRRGRAFALGARALVDNSADLVRTARREHELAPAYAALIRALVTRAAGGHAAQEHWLDHLAARRGATPPGELAAEADKAATRDDLLAVARKLYDWRGEMTRERR